MKIIRRTQNKRQFEKERLASVKIKVQRIPVTPSTLLWPPRTKVAA